ncbi:MAG: hypothetical protein AAB388_03365 [Patescibacteria group bacterium]
MNRKTLIIIGALLILLLIGVWSYLLFFADKQAAPGDTFADLDLGDTTDGTVTDTETDGAGDGSTDTVIDSSSDKALRQLTTKHVAGYAEVTTGSSSPKVYFVEAGVGHVFALDVESGTETRLSGTSVPGAEIAVIMPDGKHLVIETNEAGGKQTYIADLNETESSLALTPIEGVVVSLHATEDNELLFAEQTNSSVVGKAYNFAKKTTRTLFTIPFREAMIDWGSTAKSIHYVYPKATRELEGFLYKIEAGTLTRLPVDGFGLTAEGEGSTVLYAEQADAVFSSTLVYATTTSPLSLPVLPEKCIFTSGATRMLCARDTSTELTSSLPDSWYQGAISFADSLWSINVADQSTDLLSNTLSASGRALDITRLSLYKDDSRLYFQNKNDDSLWLLTLPDKLPTLAETNEQSL